MLVEGHALANMGLVEMARQDHEAAASRLEEAIALLERCDDDLLESTLSSLRAFLGMTLLARGEAEQAERAFEEALASARRLKHPAITQIPLYYLAQTALARGRSRKSKLACSVRDSNCLGKRRTGLTWHTFFRR